MADLCIWQASGLAGIHNASLYISLKNGGRNHFEEDTKFKLCPLSARWEIELNSKQIVTVYFLSPYPSYFRTALSPGFILFSFTS
jgi:hypothetical protein